MSAEVTKRSARIAARRRVLKSSAYYFNTTAPHLFAPFRVQLRPDAWELLRAHPEMKIVGEAPK